MAVSPIHIEGTERGALIHSAARARQHAMMSDVSSDARNHPDRGRLGCRNSALSRVKSFWCQGRRETRPKGGAKHCHRGLRGEMVRGGRDEAGGGVSRKRREGVARAQFPAGGDAERSGCSVLFSRAAVVEAEALAVHFQDMDVMGQSVEQRPGQALGTERLGPFVEGKIRGDQNRGALVAL